MFRYTKIHNNNYMHFKDRQHAGEQLAHVLKKYKDKNSAVYALPRGGVVVGAMVAKTLQAPLNLLIVRKIGHPYNPEYAIAAVFEHGDIVSNEEELSHVDPVWFKKAVAVERAEATRRRKLYLKNKKPIPAKDKVCIIVDDGLATGLTMKVAIQELRRQKPKSIIVAVPVAPAEVVTELAKLVDDIVVLYVPTGLFAVVGSYYQDFDQVTDEQVITFMKG